MGSPCSLSLPLVQTHITGHGNTRDEIKGNESNSIKMQCHICQNIHSSAFTFSIPAFSCPSFNVPSPGSLLFPTHDFFYPLASPLLLLPPHFLQFIILPSTYTFCLSSAMLLVRFLPFTEILSCQLHFSLCLRKDRKV